MFRSIPLFFLSFFVITLFGCTDSPEGPDDIDRDPEPEVVIQQIDPNEGTVGTNVTITGEGFGTNKNSVTVTFSGAEANIDGLSDKEIITSVPEQAETGVVQIEVGDVTTTGPTFTIMEEEPAFTIHSTNPDSGYPGTEVEIEGENFLEFEAELTVTFGGSEGKIDDITDQFITAIVPESAVTGAVELSTKDETATGPEFTVVQPPEMIFVEGRVTSEDTDIGVEGVEITFSNGAEPVQTDQNGDWSAKIEEGAVAVSAQSDQWEFAVHTRLILGDEQNVNFNAYQTYEAPNGNRIAYHYREGCSGGTSCDKPYSIWLSMTNGLHKEKITDDEGSDRHPTWSPDASQIAFHSDRGSDSNTNSIWIMNNDGSEMENTGAEGYQPAWSPNGDEIAYVNDGDIYVMNLNGNTERIFHTVNQFASSPAWSPDGTKITFDLNDWDISETHIWVMESDGSRPTQLTERSLSATNRSPAWEPSGRGILFSSRPAAVDRLRIIDLDGNNPRREENWPDHSQTEPSWSSTGGSILYVNRRMIPISERVRRMPAIPSATFEWSNIAPDSDAEEEFWAGSPAWSPQRVQ